jgi:hypothetical protein
VKRKINHQVTLKPQDLMVLFKLIAIGEKSNTYSGLSEALGVSSSEVHASIGRAKYSRLLNVENDRPVVVRAALKDFLLHGAKYAFPATLGSPSRGMPTAYAAPPLVTLVSQPNELPPVWPDAGGNKRGVSFYPLYPTAPLAARKDRALYEFLALFDALRGGAARERQIAARILGERLV